MRQACQVPCCLSAAVPIWLSYEMPAGSGIKDLDFQILLNCSVLYTYSEQLLSSAKAIFQRNIWADIAALR